MFRTLVSRSSQRIATTRLPFTTAQSMEEFKHEKLSGEQEGIVVMGFNRPKAKNSYSRSLVSVLSDTVASLKFDKNIRCLLLRSYIPGIFCTGVDLKERAVMSQEEVGPFVSELRRMVREIHNFPMPTIAALDGLALGGGMELALACDLRVSSSTAMMGLVETKLAIVPGGVAIRKLSRLIEPSLAKEIMFTGRVINGTEAYRNGIVNHVVKQNRKGNAAFCRALQLAEEIRGSLLNCTEFNKCIMFFK